MYAVPGVYVRLKYKFVCILRVKLSIHIVLGCVENTSKMY